MFSYKAKQGIIGTWKYTSIEMIFILHVIKIFSTGHEFFFFFLTDYITPKAESGLNC